VSERPEQANPDNTAATTPATGQPAEEPRGERGPLTFCGMCGALNPSTNYYCAACGTTLVDAFHATEGLRVYERPDSASRLITIVPSGSELEIVDDPEAPEDFVRVRLDYGRLGYIRLQEVEALAEGRSAPNPTEPDINTNARGCVTTTGALGALVLAIVLGAFLLVVAIRANTYDQGTLAIVFCVTIGPLLFLTIVLYLFARSREDRLEAERDETDGGAS
jgi:hypothetical protein